MDGAHKPDRFGGEYVGYIPSCPRKSDGLDAYLTVRGGVRRAKIQSCAPEIKLVSGKLFSARPI